MFDDIPAGSAPTPAPGAPTPKPNAEPEDILATVDASAPVAAGPVARPPILQPVSPASRLAPQPVDTTGGHRSRVIMLVIIIVLGVGVLGAAGWYAWTLMGGKGLTIGLPNTPADTTIGSQLPPPSTVIVQTPPPLPSDTDHDGLSDEEEATYRTNPAVVDSDSDGLTDRDEIRVFKTDPLNRDTDADTFGDGDEVRNGYDPKGPGKLLNLPQ